MNRLIRCLSIVVDKKVDPTVVFLTTRETGREERSTEDFCPWNNVVIAVDVAELCVCVCACVVHMVKYSAGLLLVTLPRLKLN